MLGLKKYIQQYKGFSSEIYLLFICTLVYGIGNFIWPLITLIFKHRLGYSEEVLGYFIAATVLGQMPFLLIGSKIPDKIGKKKTIAILYFLGAILYFACGIFELSIFTACVILLVVVMFSLLPPVLNAIISDYTGIENRKAAYSFIYLAQNIGAAIGPVLAGLLFENYLTLLFFGDSLSMVICFIIYVKLIKKENKKSNTYQKRESIKSPNEGLKTEKKGIFQIIIDNPILIIIAVAMFVFQLANIQWGYLLPLQLVDMYQEHGSKYYGIIAGIDGLSLIVMTPLLTHRLKKVSSLKTFALGGICFVTAFLIFGIAKYVILFMIAMAILAMGEMMIFTNYNVLIANNTKEEYRTRVNATLAILTGSGFAIGPVVMGKLSFLSYTVRWFGVATLVFIVSIGLLLYGKRKSMQLNAMEDSCDIYI